MKIDVLNESRFPRISGRQRGSAMRKLSVPNYENNNVNNNATASKETCGRVSFKGTLASEAAQSAEKWTVRLGKKLYKNMKAQNTFSKVVDNKLLAEAIAALLVTCTARPLTILATPTKSVENKEKNKYAAAKSVASGLIGLGATFLIATPFTPIVKRVMETLKEDGKFIEEANVKDIARYIATKQIDESVSAEFMEKISKSSQHLIDIAHKTISDVQLNKIFKLAEKSFTEGMDSKEKIAIFTDLIAKRLRNEISTMDTFLNKVHSPASLPLKAAATIALVPIILGAIGLKKGKSSSKANAEAPKEINNNLLKGEMNPVFKNIAMAGGVR